MNRCDWSNIRSYNGSQNNAFEELVCQLAREEEFENQKCFTRIGAPDGGIEAYRIISNGQEYGWQAKFFTHMADPQWRQLEQSFKKAFSTHPNLVKYYICLPLDRSNPLIPKQSWFMDEWNNKVKEWEKYAQSNGRRVEFEYWGSSELMHRLSQEKHSGRIYFWFNKEELSGQWLSERLKNSIDSLGSRYTPELNFKLLIAKVFDGIARDDKFKRQFEVVIDELLIKLSKTLELLYDERLKKERKILGERLQQIKKSYLQINFSEMDSIDYAGICIKLDKIQEIVLDCDKLILKIVEEEKAKQKDGREKLQDYQLLSSERFGYASSGLRELLSKIVSTRKYLQSDTALLSNKPVLILKGGAGIGKSHLLADIAKSRDNEGKFGMLFLGQHFVSEENPWTQILNNMLRLKCNEIEFLGALDAKAQSMGSRIIIYIDAINEGRGKYFWPDNINSFIKSFEKYKWLGLVISVRDSYEQLLVPRDSITNDMIIRVTHYGFAGVEYEATKLYFTSYKIQQPSVPLLHPEFQNPLFLKLFCEGIQKAGLHVIPEGYEGITTIINFYLDSVNLRLAYPSRLNYPDNINLVEAAVKLLVRKRIEVKLKHVPYEEAFSLVEKELQKYSDKRRFLDELISEGVLTKNLFWDNKGKHYEGVYFAYERFEDHILISELLERYLDKTNPQESFKKGTPLFELIKDNNTCFINRNIIEALSIQLPELISKEVYEIAPHCKSFYPVIESFVKSLIWRKSSTITDKLSEYINDYVLKYEETNSIFLSTLLLIASNPKHKFNAEYLHKHLMKFSLSDRDAWWTMFVNNQYGEKTSVMRLIDWAWSEEEKNHVTDEVILLCAKAIIWFLASSNRFLRDSSTKALVALLESRIPVLIQLLKEFEHVNDPYIYERIYAVSYGCALRTSDRDGLFSLCKHVYETIFNKEYVYPHILLRDYAREIIEYAFSIGLQLDIKLDKIRPPYKSIWAKQIPTNEDIKKLEHDYEAKGFKDYYWSLNSIISSMQPAGSELDHMYGDFGRYVFQNALSNWRDLNIQQLSNLVVKRIMELGYDIEKHGKYDRNIVRHGPIDRRGNKAERIGKKYQWIAFYELLAKVSDNFIMYDERSYKDNIPMKYDGPWEPYVRDIDPTMLVKVTGRERYEITPNHWWFNVNYNDWECSHQDWIARKNKIPDPIELILVRDNNSREWLVLESYPEWSEPKMIGQDKWDHPHKNLWYQIRSYLVPRKEFNGLVKWAANQNFMGKCMPETRSRYEIFSREYFWSPAYKYFAKPFYSGETWQEVKDPANGQCVGKVIGTAENFLWEEEYDCSKEGTICYLKPCEVIYQGLKMRFSKNEGEILNKSGETICCDPSVNSRTLSCLLIRKNDFTSYLEKNDLKMLWTVLGEKRILGGGFSHDNKFNRLEINGVYYLDKDSIKGILNSTESK
ncbi:MAG: AVAST type 2 anti-phage system protein Avs2 [Dehalococcoidales bacterium]